MTLRVLAVTGRGRYPESWIANLWERLDLDEDVELKVLAAKKPRRKFDAEFFPIPQEPSSPPEPRGWGRLKAALSRTESPPPVRASLKERLADACRTGAEPAELADWADVVVAMDDAGCLGVWELARRVPDAVYVNRMAQVREALESGTHALTPSFGPPLPAATEADRMPPLPAATTRLLIAPANYAGQAHAWAGAVNRHVPDAAAQNFKDRRLTHPYPSDLTIDRPRFQGDLAWRRYWREHVASAYTHVIVEAGLPVLGESSMPLDQVVAELRDSGLQVALLSHGSDARIPSVHAANERWAQYSGMDPAWVRLLETVALRNVNVYTSDPGPVFLSTPGLLEFVPQGIWLPLVVDVDLWHTDAPVLERDIPVVAHAPSSKQKGSHHIDPVLADLAERGLIEYRRVEGVPIEEMPQVYGSADIVVDQFGAADYGAAACEAMAAGRIVVSHVAAGVRDHLRRETGLDLPIVQADPETLRDVIVQLVEARDEGRVAAAASREFAEAVHNGELSAQILSHWFEQTSRRPVPPTGPPTTTK